MPTFSYSYKIIPEILGIIFADILYPMQLSWSHPVYHWQEASHIHQAHLPFSSQIIWQNSFFYTLFYCFLICSSRIQQTPQWHIPICHLIIAKQIYKYAIFYFSIFSFYGIFPFSFPLYYSFICITIRFNQITYILRPGGLYVNIFFCN